MKGRKHMLEEIISKLREAKVATTRDAPLIQVGHDLSQGRLLDVPQMKHEADDFCFLLIHHELPVGAMPSFTDTPWSLTTRSGSGRFRACANARLSIT